VQGAKSPLLWDEGQAAELLAGSPVVAEIEARLEVGGKALSPLLVSAASTGGKVADANVYCWMQLPCSGAEPT
jgi:hypothetical protein